MSIQCPLNSVDRLPRSSIECFSGFLQPLLTDFDRKMVQLFEPCRTNHVIVFIQEQI